MDILLNWGKLSVEISMRSVINIVMAILWLKIRNGRNPYRNGNHIFQIG